MSDQKRLDFTLSHTRVDNNDASEEPPPAYSPPLDSLLPPASHSGETKVQYNFANLSLEHTYNPSAFPQAPTQETPEVMEQLLRLTSDFVRQAQDAYPALRHDIPGGKLTATLHIAPDEAVPASDGWHLTQASQTDDMLRGQIVSMARVRASKIQKVAGMDQKQVEEMSGGLQYDSRPPVDLLFPTAAPSGPLWWGEGRQAHMLSQNLNTRIQELQGEKRGQKHEFKDDSPGLTKLSLTAEETTFRRSNSMGLWESKSGWTIVVRVW